MPVHPFAARLALFFRQLIRIPTRLLALLVAATLLVAAGVKWAGEQTPPPRFRLAANQSSIEPVTPSLLSQASDWLEQRRYVLLTFDDGPYGHGIDEQILQTLNKHHAHALFFLVCSHLTGATAHVPGEILKSGNLIGNHSFDHGHLTAMGTAALHHEIVGCSRTLSALTGKRPRYFRPPFGQSSPLVQRIAEGAGMRQMLWNANSEDSWLKDPGQILRWSAEQTDDRSILLLHDMPATAAALDSVLTNLERHGFTFVLPEEIPETKPAPGNR